MRKTILALETASTVCGAAVVSNGECIGLIEMDANRKHAEILPGIIQQVLNECKLDFNQLDAIAVSIGPGSFTGLRIGLGMAKGMAYSQGLPIVPVPTMDSIALSLQNHQPKNGIIHSHGNRVFYQQFNWENGFPISIDKPGVGDIENYIDSLDSKSFEWNCTQLIPNNLNIEFC